MTARGRLATAVAALVVPLALLTACGDDSGSSAADPGDTPSATQSSDTPSETAGETASDEGTPSDMTTGPADPPDWPACETIWVEDQKIPGQYQGCLEGSNAVAADNLSCSSGQRIVRYQDRFFGVAGGTIYQTSGPLDQDKQYLKMVRTCRA